MKQIKINQNEDTKVVIEHYEDGKVFIFGDGFGRFVVEVGSEDYTSTSDKRYAGALSDRDVENIVSKILDKLGDAELVESYK